VGILLEDGTRHAHEGRLQFADVTVDESTGSFALRAIVPNPQSVLRPGMYVRAELVVGGASAAVLAPQQGITRDAKGGATALVVAGDGTVEQRSVTVSRTLGDRWLVEGGLAAGDRLIVEGLQKVRPGMPVEAVEATGDRPLPPPGADAPAAAS
jgi:membrane fusion protein (multidrug efflux system)